LSSLCVHKFNLYRYSEGREDLALLVSGGLSTVPAAPIEAVVDFYLAARAEAVTTLLDSAVGGCTS
jgi:hypothetical protein